jgi:D-alanine-D-alanine ligase
MNLTIGLVCDLRKEYLEAGFSEEAVAEFDSEATALALEKAIRSLGHKVERIGHARALCSALAAGKRWDLVFNIAEGVTGRSREAQVPAILETYAIPYTFSDPLTCAITLDKSIAKRLIREAGIPTPAFAVVSQLADVAMIKLEFPLFVKPTAEGTGKGITADSRVSSMTDIEKLAGRLLKQYAQPILVEEFLPGREFTVAVLGTGPEARVLGTMEIEIQDSKFNGIYSYATKELCEKLVRYSPAPRDSLRAKVEDLALRAHRALECRDASRVDIRLDRNHAPGFMEINPIPGLHPTHSDLPMIATQEGMSYEHLIQSIIESALTRSSLHAR